MRRTKFLVRRQKLIGDNTFEISPEEQLELQKTKMQKALNCAGKDKDLGYSPWEAIPPFLTETRLS
jgi:hypothetical protein